MPLAGHDKINTALALKEIISTPMPLAGHDGNKPLIWILVQYFYSHAPRGA